MAIEKNIKINVDAEDAIKQVDTLEQGVLAVMIEKTEAFDDLENILSVKRIDMVQCYHIFAKYIKFIFFEIL